VPTLKYMPWQQASLHCRGGGPVCLAASWRAPRRVACAAPALAVSASGLCIPQGRARWQRMLAAWYSLPRQSPSSKLHLTCLEAAMKGAPLRMVRRRHALARMAHASASPRCAAP
jgi:hypothetical protein